MCLCNDSNTGTNIVSIDEVLDSLSNDIISILKEDNFIIRSPDSFDIKQSKKTSILKDINMRTEIQLSLDVTTPLSKDAEEALKMLIDSADRLHYRHVPSGTALKMLCLIEKNLKIVETLRTI